jgi:hypothetical protein
MLQTFATIDAALPAIRSRRIATRLRMKFAGRHDSITVVPVVPADEAVILNEAVFIYDGTFGGAREGRMYTADLGQFAGDGVYLSFSERGVEMVAS